ncbi:MAG: response regulator transcription factor [Spirochaetota bacterium]|nr:response regulator transcription factor [Spirochaetota bacterium]
MEKKIYKVIILEDEIHNQEVIQKLVTGRDDLDLVFTASDGDEAVRICRTAFPDIALVDINVPMMSGLEVAKIAQELEIAVIFTTAMTRYALDAFNLGAAGYLVKPFTKNQFDKAIDRAIVLKKNNSISPSTAGSDKPENILPTSFHNLLRIDYLLTPTELEIVDLIMSGCSRDLLEEKTGKTARTVKSHLQSLYQKTINQDPRESNIGRSDKFGRLIYFLFTLERKYQST